MTPDSKHQVDTIVFDSRGRCAGRAELHGMRKLLLLSIVSAAAVALLVCRVQAQTYGEFDADREYAIKAAYLYQFARYVEWPANSFLNAESPLVIGVLGTDPFGSILEEIARTKRVDGRSIIVRRFISMDQYTPCNILFITASSAIEQKQLAIEKTRGAGVLLVGEEPGFAEHGGMINFFLERNNIRFEINPEIAKSDQIKISSKLLSLAKIVETIER